MHLIAPFGFYGWGNIGDESTLQGFARLVSHAYPEMRVWVASRNPAHTARVEPAFRYCKHVRRNLRWRWAQLRALAYVVPGGTPIMDVLGEWPLSELAPLVQAAYGRRKPVVFIGTGTEKLHREASKRVVSDVLASAVQHWTVRCGRDKERLTAYGVAPERVTVAADLAWTLDPVSEAFGRECLRQWGLDARSSFVGVNVNNEQFVQAQEPRLSEKLGRFLDALVEKYKVSILFFCNEVREDAAFDKAASLKVLGCMKHREKAFLVPNQYWSPQQMLSLIGCCSVTIGIRYHFCLFSALQGVPFIALQRSDKVADLCWDLDWLYGVSLNPLDDTVLTDMFKSIDQERLFLRGSLQKQTQIMRERALQKNRIALDILTRQGAS